MKLVEFIRENENWEELLAGAPYYVKVKRKQFENCSRALVKFCYDQRISDFSIPLVCECRGVILEEGTWNIVARAMDKFGNYGEDWVDKDSFDWATVSVQEKIDGSLIMLYYYNGWRIGTRNTVDAYDAELNCGGFKSFGDLALYVFNKVLEKNKTTYKHFTDVLGQKSTYWFELVSPFNRVIIDYKDCNLYFLGWRVNCHREEVESKVEDSICSRYFPIPKRYLLHSLANCLAAAREMDADEEGFVVCDGNFNRMKIKSSKYLELAYLRNNGVWSDKRMIEVILKGEEKEVLSYFPEWKERLTRLRNRMGGLKFEAKYYYELAFGIYDAMGSTSRAAFAQIVKRVVNEKFHSYCFWKFDHRDGTFDIWAEKYLTVNKWAELMNKEGKEWNI